MNTDSNLLLAYERNEKGKKTRRQGFIPAVLYGKGLETRSIKLNTNNFIKIVNKHGKKSKIRLKLNDEVQFAIIKDVAIDTISGQVLNVDIQKVNQEETIHWDIPIVYHGKEFLESKLLVLQTTLDTVEVSGKVKDIPDYVEFDVGKLNYKDTVTIGDLKLNENLKTVKSSDTSVAVINSTRNNEEEDSTSEIA